MGKQRTYAFAYNDRGAWKDQLTKVTYTGYNALKYRGYYYDGDFGLYYLSSRYFDPLICRFISPDGEISGVGEEMLGYNMYAYGFNNPVTMKDPDGNWPKWAKKVAIGVAVIAAAAIVTVATGGTGIVGCIAAGALKGAVIGGAIGAAAGGAKAAIKHRAKTGSWKGAAKAARDGFMWGTITGAVTGGRNSKYCFVAGTLILLADGTKVIEDIAAGDLVWSENPDTGEKELKQVVQTFENETDELVHVDVNGEEIITTPEHPFYSPVKGWIKAVDLRAGDILVLQSGRYVIVEKVQHEILEEPITVYNFEVEDFHTYFVGLSYVLVHNRCGHHSEEQEIVVELAKEYSKKGGISRDNANALVELAEEFGLNNHYPQIHEGRSGIWGVVEHIKVFKYHIPVFD